MRLACGSLSRIQRLFQRGRVWSRHLDQKTEQTLQCRNESSEQYFSTFTADHVNEWRASARRMETFAELEESSKLPPCRRNLSQSRAVRDQEGVGKLSIEIKLEVVHRKRVGSSIADGELIEQYCLAMTSCQGYLVRLPLLLSRASLTRLLLPRMPALSSKSRAFVSAQWLFLYSYLRLQPVFGEKRI